MKPYFIKNTYSSSQECRAIINLRIGYTAIGLARKQFGNSKNILRKIFPLFSFVVYNHSG